MCIMTNEAMNPKESITLSDHNRRDKPHAPHVCNTMEGSIVGQAILGDIQ